MNTKMTGWLRARTLKAVLATAIALGGVTGVALGLTAPSAGASACSTTFSPDQSSGFNCDITSTLTLGGDGFALAATPTLDWGSANLNGYDQIVSDSGSGDGDVDVMDATGSADGWNLTMEESAVTASSCTVSAPSDLCTQFADRNFNSNTDADGLATNAINVILNAAGASNPLSTSGGAVTDVCANDTDAALTGTASECTLLTNVPTLPVINAGTGGTATTLFSASAASSGSPDVLAQGMGTNDFSGLEWYLYVPADTPAGAYETTITLTLNSGPA